MTTVPLWTVAGAEPDTGHGRYRTEVPPDLVAALRRLAADRGAALPAVLLAAHVKVLAALTSERAVLTGYRSGDGLKRCAATVADGPWLALLAEADRAAAEAVPGPAAATVLDLRGLDAVPATDDEPDAVTALRIRYTADGDRLTLWLDHRRDAFTDDFAARVAGYHLAALRLIAADPQARHEEQSLLSAAELATQLHDLGGARRPLPDELFVELFERQAAQRPEETAAVHGPARWTYRQLNARANQIAHRLLELGVRDEDVVAVVMERNLDWLAAMLGVFKAGGVYLPVRPDFPADRVATQLRRSDCRYAVTEPGSAATLHAAAERAGRACATVLVADAYAGTGTGNPGRPLAPGQLAYVYFTSGSTGEPKGALCEHAGMLNHLYMKVDDLRLRAGDVVTQTASQCFDISLWQLAAPLLVGGCTEIVDLDVQLDVNRFIDRLARGGVHVIQIVPAYLDVLLTHLESNHRALGDLRSVSVTGEALKLGLVRRWFALYPDIPVVNAYGATEVSDDTMHAVLDGVPARDSGIVTVGRSLRNVNTYILDERLRLVPLGAPGEIAFSGVCVGRGYVNDPERTAQAFTTDPYRPGTRLYRTGDYGRWLPEGTIEFLGRRDEQVKIRGYRIEIGEIENRLSQMPGVAQAAVIIDGRSDQTRNLVAFFTGSAGLEPADLRDFLAAALPDYMVPHYFHRLETLPRNENGKVDKRRLSEVAATLNQGAAAYLPPATPTERRLATAWAEVLNVLVGRIGRADDFFQLGGTSLAAVRLVVKLDRQVSLREVVAHPVLQDLARVIDAGRGTRGGATPSPLLQRLSTVDGPGVATLVCFPYAGGNAVNFQTLARELTGAGIAVYGAELPGHDVARADEPLADVAEVARRARAELAGAAGPILLWGHCAGAAYALELAWLLEADGRPPAGIFIGALLLDPPHTLRREIDEVSALTDREVTVRLHQDTAYIELDLLKSERAELVGRAFRHDVSSTNEYLIGTQQEPAERLHTPVHVILAADDPTTAGRDGRHRSWARIADTVEGYLLDEGGHYFVRSRPADVAAIVAAACPVPAGRPA
jgi:amino acid adenylation domain-containing protein